MGDYHQRRDTCEITRKHRKKVSSGAEAVYMHQHRTPSSYLHPTALPRRQLSTSRSGFMMALPKTQVYSSKPNTAASKSHMAI